MFRLVDTDKNREISRRQNLWDKGNTYLFCHSLCPMTFSCRSVIKMKNTQLYQIRLSRWKDTESLETLRCSHPSGLIKPTRYYNLDLQIQQEESTLTSLRDCKKDAGSTEKVLSNYSYTIPN